MINEMKGKQLEVLASLLNNSWLVKNGFNDDTVIKAGSMIGLNKGELHLIFPDGLSKGLILFVSEEDNFLTSQEGINLISTEDSIRKKILTISRLRLEIATRRENSRIVFPSMTMHLLRPSNISFGYSLAYACADSIWNTIGEPSEDFSAITRRGTLATILASSFIIMTRNGWSATAAEPFLEKSIETAGKIGKCKANLKRKIKNIF